MAAILPRFQGAFGTGRPEGIRGARPIGWAVSPAWPDWYQVCLYKAVDTNPPSLELLPMGDEPASTAAAPVLSETTPSAPNELAPDGANVDKTLEAATTEYEGGYVDMPLWDRALAQAKGDRESAIPIYLRARATALQVLSRNLRASGPAIRAAAERKARQAAAQDSRAGVGPAKRRLGGRFSTRQMAVFGAAGAGVVGCAVLLYVLLGGAASSNSAVASSTATTAVRSKPAAKAGAVAAAPASATAVPKSSAPKEDLKTKVEELRGAGNFPLLVLIAVEWTRREPGNADAWSQLSMGYEALRQYDDAVDAATKAVELAPGNSLYWRNTGQMNLYANRPEDALRAFNEAAALNDADIQSLVKAGILNVQLGRMPDASNSLDKALALSPGDSEAMCLKAMVTHKLAAPKEAGPASQKVGPRDGMCHDSNERQEATVAAAPPAAKQTVFTKKR
jgi:tetratricopeptide (TPR) repeat protein